MKEFDNINIAQLAEILNENTTLKRYYALIPIRDKLAERLLNIGIVDKYMFFDAMNESVKRLAEKSETEPEVLMMLEQFLHLHDYINRRLSEFKSINPTCIQKLSEKNIRHSKDYLLLYLEQGAASISSEYKINEVDAKQLFSFCDLMRLPGVKDIRASLYYDCGYRNLPAFSTQNEETMRQHIAEYIARNNLPKSVPLLKELRTQIAVARVLPHLGNVYNIF